MTSSTRTRVIGIIGPPCSGKSTVARYLQSLGGVWLDADRVAKQQLADPDVIAEIATTFGEEVLATDGTVRRERIADLVFANDVESQVRLKKLEAIIHPRTRAILRQSLERAKSDNVPIVILDVPLLLESGWQTDCDEVWCMSVSPVHHARLLAARGWDAEELARRQARQLSWEEKRRRSDWVLENDGTIEELQTKVDDRLVV